jgi:hypothetical protein
MPHNNQEITIEVRAAKHGSNPTDKDVENAIHEKFKSHPTELFVHGDTVILKVVNFGGGKS